MAPEIGKDDVQSVEVGGHDVHPCGQLFAFSFQSRSLAGRLAYRRPCGSPAQPVDVAELAVELVEFGRKAAK
jgi:hypothetical protein